MWLLEAEAVVEEGGGRGEVEVGERAVPEGGDDDDDDDEEGGDVKPPQAQTHPTRAQVSSVRFSRSAFALC